MAKSNLAIYTQNKRTGTAICTAAKTTYSDTANAVLLHTASADGDLVRRITAVPRATVTATQLQLYRSVDGGTTLILVDTAVMPAYTMSPTTAAPRTPFDISFAQPLGLAPNERLYVGIGVALAAGIVFTCEAEGFTAGQA